MKKNKCTKGQHYFLTNPGGVDEIVFSHKDGNYYVYEYIDKKKASLFGVFWEKLHACGRFSELCWVHYTYKNAVEFLVKDLEKDIEEKKSLITKLQNSLQEVG